LKKALLIYTLTESSYQNALKQGVDVVICFESKLPADQSQITIILADDYRIEGSWKAYEYNRQLWNSMKAKSANEWQIKGIDISPMVLKKWYWGNQAIGSIFAAAEPYKNSHEWIVQVSYFSKNRIKQTLKWFKLQFISWYKSIVDKTTVPPIINRKIGVLINNEFELLQYRSILEHLPEQDILVFHYGNINLNSLGAIATVNIANIQSSIPFKCFTYFKWNTEELSAYNFLQSKWFNTANAIERINYIKSSSVSVLLMNVAENLPLRNLLKPILGNDVILCNTMNGLKAGEAHDTDVNFDYWFVWNQSLKSLLHTTCQIPLDKLIEVGHLSQDLIAHYTNQNTHNAFLEQHKGKRVVSVFSVKGDRLEKITIIKWMHQVIASRPDVVFMYKRHPLETVSNLQHLTSERIYLVPDQFSNDKQALYDQIYASEFIIVFGSTVAYESAWLNTKAYNFELRKTPFIQQGSDPYIQTISSTNELDKVLAETPKEKPAIQPSTSVAKRIADFILSHVKSF